MSGYLLDTNVWIRILTGRSPEIVARMRTHPPSDLYLSAVVKAELLFGARRSARVGENLALLQRLFDVHPDLPFDDRAAESYGVIRTALSAVGQPIGPNDLMIAATALAHDLVLVSHNTREFARVAGLRLEDWQAEPV